jgi:predicted porin
MKGLGRAAASAAVIVLGGASGAYAADLNTMPVKAFPIAGPAVCSSIMDFFTTACQVAAYGVRFYGTIDVGGSYQTNGSTYEKLAGGGINYFPAKNSLGAKWLPANNSLSISNVGIQIKEPLGAGWSFVGQLEAGFSPLGIDLLNGSHSVKNAVGVPLIQQTSYGDSNSQGQVYNNLGFAGFSNDTWGTITFGRQNSLMSDAILAFDPLGSSNAFSPLGYYGAWGGGGDTENRKATTSVKYRVNVTNWHFGVFGQFGGYDEGNASKGSVQGDVGADFNVGPGVFSTDVMGGYTKSAVSLGLSGAATAYGVGIPTGTQTMSATISNNTNVMAVARYTMEKLKLFAGYEWIQYANPGDSYATGAGFTDIAGDFVCANCNSTTGANAALYNGTNISTTSFSHADKIFQIVWFGGTYALTPSLDLTAAYYHEWQNDYSGGVATSSAVACTVASTAQSSCAGSLDAASAVLDWKFAPKWDTFIGTLYSRLNGGIDSGFLAKDNWSTTAGVRFRW